MCTSTDVIDVDAIRKPMEETYASLANQTLQWRSKALRTLLEMIRQNTSEITVALKKDMGKNDMECLVEINGSKNELQHQLSNLSLNMKAKPLPTSLILFPCQAEIRSVPLRSPGVLAIGPFNYPFLISMLSIIGPLAGGNPVVLKPSELAPHTSKLLQTLINSYFSPGVIQVVQGGKEVTSQLLKLSWGTVIFTGSERVGRIVAKACAQTLTPYILELGGKCPVYVDSQIPDFKLKTMAKRIIWGKTFNSGQTCVGPDYILCHEDIKDKLLEFMKEALVDFYGDSTKNCTKIISKPHTKRLINMIQEVQTKNSKSIIFGGAEKCNVDDQLVAPTLVLNPPRDSQMMTEEIFGNILPILEVSSEEKAIQYIQQMVRNPNSLFLFLFLF